MDEPIGITWQDRLAALDAEGRPDEALRFLQLEAFQRPDDAECNYTFARRCMDCGLLGDAIAVFTLVTRMSDQHYRFRALVDGADCLRRRSDFTRAEADLTAAMALDPGSHWSVMGMAELYAATGRDPERLPLIEARYQGLRPDGRAEIARYASGMRAYWHFEETRNQPGWRPRLPGRVNALARAGLVMMVKDEADIITQNLEHHHALGFRAFCLLDNGSTDETRAKIDDFRQRHTDAVVLYVHDPIVGYYQSDKMAIFQDTLIRYARLADIDLAWMFFVDADEFIAYAGPDDATGVERFEAVLEDDAAQLIVLHWVGGGSHQVIDAVPAHYDLFATFGKINSRLLPVVPKVGFRTGTGLVPMMGNHFVAEFEPDLSTVRTLGLDDWYMIHFPLRSLDHVRKKVVNGGKAFQNVKGLEGLGLHWRERFELYEKFGDPILRQILENHINEIN